jgi:hypothetical protein
MGLKDLKSNLDIVGGFGGAQQTFTDQSTIPGASVNNAVPDPNFNTLNGTTDSPFQTRTGDHLVDLLEDKIVNSTNTNLTYDPQQMQGIQPGPPAGDQDFDGVTGGQGYFHGVANPGKGQGKQINGKDLHEHLLTDSYNYNHGNASENVGPSPGATGNSEFQDIDGLEGPKFDKGDPSTVHADPSQGATPTQLVESYTSTVNPLANHGNSTWPVVPAVDQDLNGLPGQAFNGNPGTLHTDLLANTYNSAINGLSSFGAGQPGGTWPTVQPSPLASTPFADLDGITPSKYENNLPS